MPPRLNKRQQRELEELEALKSAKPAEASEASAVSDDDAAAGPSERRGGGFMNLLAPESEEEDEDEVKSSKSRKSKKKKKKPTETTIPTPPPPPKITRTSTPAPPVRNEKKAQKKARAKEKKAANDELDQALAELSIQYPASQKISQAESGKPSLADLLSVSLQHLDGEAEMRRFFGSKVVQANKTEQSSSGRNKKVPAVKSNLTRPQPTWWAAKGREGLSLRALSDEEVDDKLKRHGWTPLQERWWTIEYSKKYKSMTKAFFDTVLSGDPQGFWDLLGTLPWHADTLLQISEVYRHREEYAQAVDFIDRALFTYERAFIGAFTFTTGLNRLDFDRVENRPFFLALHRQVTDLQRRGCVRTAFEFARLMYTLDPWNDPHGSLLHLDFLAIKAGMHQWLLDVYGVFADRDLKSDTDAKARLNPSFLPGWAYARALALRISEEANKATDRSASSSALKEAVCDFPSIVPLLADKLDVSLPANIRGHRDFSIVTDAGFMSAELGILHLLSHLYVQRSSSLWKEHAAWFASTITEGFSTLPASLAKTQRRTSFLSLYNKPSVRYSVYRHIMVLETSYRRLFSFIPREVLEAKSLACDPLPPPTSLSQYDQTFFQSVEDIYSSRMRSRRQRANDERRLAQLIPDAAFRQQLQAFFDAHPHFAERFPGGIMQFAQMAGQMPPDVLEDLMLVEAVNADAGGAGGMPGGFQDDAGFFDDEEGDERGQEREDVAPDRYGPGIRGVILNMNPDFQDPLLGGAAVPQADEIEDEGVDEDDDEDEEEDISPMPRMLRNVLGRFFGRSAPAEESSSDEEAPLDDTGVD